MMEPIVKQLTVPLPVAEAFALFTDQMGTWWPLASHSVKGAKSKVTFPREKGGEIIETDADGQRHIWGRLIAYDPEGFLSFTWHPGRPEEEATAITITFTATSEGTFIELTHGGFDILGTTADAVSTSYLKGWDLVLGCFMSAAKAPVMA